MKAKILLVEDNPHIMKINASTLNEEGYEIFQAETLAQAQTLNEEKRPDLIVLDLMLPDGSGIDFCKELRRTSRTPVLILSARDANEDVVQGLRAGGDDYLAKPYSLEILLARIEALLRRSAPLPRQDPAVCAADILKLNPVSLCASVEGQEIQLTQKEFSVLTLLAQNTGRCVKKEKLYEAVWKQPLSGDSQALWAVISRLKRKLEDCGKRVGIKTLRQGGYQLKIIQ
jgi:DNA-binding response OmpR family regulator